MRAEHSYLSVDRSLRSWLLTRDHKRIGVMFLIATTIFLIVGGILALIMRTELLTPRQLFIDAMTYNRYFTLHGVVMVFLFMIPAIPSGFGNFLLPIMLGAHDVAFPRLNLASFYVYVLGAIFLLTSIIVSSVDTGWTFYVPYAAQSPTAVAPAVFGVFILGWSSIMTGLNFIVTTHTMRARGMGWHDMPLFVWSIYATSIIQVLATPVLGLTLILVLLENVAQWGIFDPSYGGDPILFQHLFWFYSHPAVYIMVLPAMAVVSEVICAFSRKNPLSYHAIAYSSIGIAFIGFLVWGHHMFTAGLSTFGAGVFGILSMFVGIFSAIKVFTWTGTLYKGAIAFRAPLAYILAFLFLFVFGGMTGVAIATSSLDVHWHDTYFIVAHFHFIMVGSTITAFLAAMHYWFPLLTGRMYPERLAMLGVATVFAGFFLTFFPQFLMGNGGMPRRYYNYEDVYQPLHVVSTGGAWVLGLGLFVILFYLLWSLRWGRPSGHNPWHSAGYEWTTTVPPSPHNFEGTPRFHRHPYDYTKVDEDYTEPEGPHHV